MKSSYFMPLALLLILPLGGYAFAQSFELIDVLEDTSVSPTGAFGSEIEVSEKYIAIGNAGVVQVYDKQSLSLITEISDPDLSNVYDRFGSQISIFGEKILVGDMKDDTQGTDSGRAHLFDIDGTLIRTFENPTPLEGDLFGNSLALSEKYAVIAAMYDNTGGFGSYSGAVYVFDLNPELGAQELRTIYTPLDRCCTHFGSAVDISNNIILIGQFTRSAEAFLYDLDTDSFLDPLINPSNESGDRFSYTLAIDGDKALIGAFSEPNESGVPVGEVYLFNVFTGELLYTFPNPSPNNGDEFGLTLSISGDDILIGANRDNNNGKTSNGIAYLYDTEGNHVQTFQRDIPQTNGQFGRSVAINGDTIAIGSIYNEAGTSETGSAFLYKIIASNNGPIINSLSSIITEPILVNSQITFDATFSDIDILDSHTALWEWGDGTTSAGTITESGGSGSVHDSHTYSTPGVYTVTLTVTDQDGLSDTESATEFVVVYDPNGGFVTGGGWIDSPAGSCNIKEPEDGICDSDVTGKATFGFVSKYKNGATEPSGNTQFQFKAGNLNFKSSDYEWLTIVISGAKAQYKGTGTINGEGDYGFILTGFDAELNDSDSHTQDKFRIKIWNNAEGSGVIYDNKMGASDDVNDGTEIGGGNIKIHKNN